MNLSIDLKKFGCAADICKSEELHGCLFHTSVSQMESVELLLIRSHLSCSCM